MSIQDELSEEAKGAILNCIREALRHRYEKVTRDVLDELLDAEYAIPRYGGLKTGPWFRLTDKGVDEVIKILETNFFN